jgi:hypothetical protein
MTSEALLLWGVLFSSMGLGYFMYGKKQEKPVPLVCGLALMVYPYFVDSVLVAIAVGAILIAVPYFVRW